MLKTIETDLLDSVTGAGGLSPLSGDVKQSINTNWGGSQTNIANQVIHNHLPPLAPTTVTEYMRQHPEARLQASRNRPIKHGWW